MGASWGKMQTAKRSPTIDYGDAEFSAPLAGYCFLLLLVLFLIKVFCQHLGEAAYDVAVL